MLTSVANSSATVDYWTLFLGQRLANQSYRLYFHFLQTKFNILSPPGPPRRYHLNPNIIL